MNDEPFPLGFRVAVLFVVNIVLWVSLFRLGQAAHYFVYG